MEPIVIWRITDGKPGHESQTRGLADALTRLVAVDVRELEAPGRLAAGWAWLSGRFSPGLGLPAPDLILAAGHRTHLAALAARRAWGGRVVVLMRPSLPAVCFDLCLVPQHDGIAASDRVILTTGALNPVRAAKAAASDRGLLLVGGPSKHHDWNEAAIIGQVRRIVSGQPQTSWIVTTSPRTPAGTARALEEVSLENLEVVPFEETRPGWVAARLQEHAVVWVTEDSVSMVFEALTAGAAVGLLQVPARKEASRVSRSADLLLEEKRVVRLPPAGEVPVPRAQQQVLAEADRCARIVMERFFPGS